MSVPLPLVLVALAVAFYLGGLTAYWFEDVLRGPIMRVVDRSLEQEELMVLTNED